MKKKDFFVKFNAVSFALVFLQIEKLKYIYINFNIYL